MARTLSERTSATDVSRVVAYEFGFYVLPDGELRARLNSRTRSFMTPLDCPGMTGEEFADARSYLRVVVPRTCLSELEPGPFRLEEVRLFTPNEGGGSDDYLSPRPIVVK